LVLRGIGDNLLKLITICRDRFDKAVVSLLTNGRKFRDFEFARQLAEINHPNLLICVSLNADTDTQHDYILGAKNSFREAVEGIQNLAIFGQRIEIRVVIQALNYKRLPQLAEYIYRNFPFVFHIAFMGMEVCGLAVENIDEIWIDPYDYQKQLKDAVLELHRRMMNVSIYNVPLCLLPPELWSFARQSISTWKNIYLPICEQCSVKGDCCGTFSTSGQWQSKRIAPVQARPQESSDRSSDFA
jgi:His-Xaa-Ser system radical SAM maturase HxsC